MPQFFLFLPHLFLEYTVKYYHCTCCYQETNSSKKLKLEDSGYPSLISRELGVFSAAFQTAIEISSLSSVCLQNGIIRVLASLLFSQALKQRTVIKGIKEIQLLKRQKDGFLLFIPFAKWQSLIHSPHTILQITICYLPSDMSHQPRLPTTFLPPQ